MFSIIVKPHTYCQFYKVGEDQVDLWFGDKQGNNRAKQNTKLAKHNLVLASRLLTYILRYFRKSCILIKNWDYNFPSLNHTLSSHTHIIAVITVNTLQDVKNMKISISMKAHN